MMSGGPVGTLSYLSAEQVMARAVDACPDIYSLGTLLYECVLGSPSFSGDAQAVLYRIVHERPRSPCSLVAEIGAELSETM